jgi:hypothetical protein
MLVGMLMLCALYEGVRAVFAFRTATTGDDVAGANFRALAAIAFVALGSGLALRYVGIVLFGLLAAAYIRHVAKRRTEPQLSER